MTVRSIRATKSPGVTSLRIIGGSLNGRKIRIPVNADLRPSGDRLREALFSYLGALDGLCCLDLFAGSGALGFSALSRGAAHISFVEKNRRTAAALRDYSQQLTVGITTTEGGVTVHNMPAARFLVSRHALGQPAFDLIFLDPPFSDYPDDASWAKLLATCRPHLTPTARVYCEHARAITVPPGWQRQTLRRVGKVHWQILQQSIA